MKVFGHSDIGGQYAEGTIRQGGEQGQGRCHSCGGTEEHTARCSWYRQDLADWERQVDRQLRQQLDADLPESGSE